MVWESCLIIYHCHCIGKCELAAHKSLEQTERLYAGHTVSRSGGDVCVFAAKLLSHLFQLCVELSGLSAVACLAYGNDNDVCETVSLLESLYNICVFCNDLGNCFEDSSRSVSPSWRTILEGASVSTQLMRTGSASNTERSVKLRL